MKLRDYQQDLSDAVDRGWARGSKNMLAVLPTGGGKTVVFCHKIRENVGPAIAIAHRQELVGQISLALAKENVRHTIIAPSSVVRLIVKSHMEELGRSYYDPNSVTAVAGVGTLARRSNIDFNRYTLWVQDECHHVLRDNQWGRAAALFPNARGLGVTATPLRADGKGLGRHADGLFDEMVIGAEMRDLIESGSLTDYRVFAPPSDIDLAKVNITASGDFNRDKLKVAVRESCVIGDVVKSYLRIAPGKLGVTFATDVETATDIAEQFRAAGVPAEVVSAKTPPAERASILARFRRRELLQLVNVDLFGEGFDLPAIEAVSMARPTESYGLYVQQFGRALRKLDGKVWAIIIDHVGNVLRHGLPDRPREWTLNARERKSKGPASDEIPLRACVECTGVYERVLKVCPYCGAQHMPMVRSGIDFVDGDVTELDAATLAEMRKGADDINRTAEEYREELACKHVPTIGQMANVKRHVANQEAQETLRASILYWAGIQRSKGRDDSESYSRFYFRYGVDVLSAQGLKKADAEKLNLKIIEDINTHHLTVG